MGTNDDLFSMGWDEFKERVQKAAEEKAETRDRISQLRRAGRQQELYEQLQALRRDLLEYLKNCRIIQPHLMTVVGWFASTRDWFALSPELEEKEELTDQDIARFRDVTEQVKTQLQQYLQLIQSPDEQQGRFDT